MVLGVQSVMPSKVAPHLQLYGQPLCVIREWHPSTFKPIWYGSPLTCAVGEVAFRVVHIQTPQVIRCKSNSIDPLVFRHAVVLFPPGLRTSPPWTHISTFCLCSGRSASYSIGEWTPLIPQLRWVHANAHTSFLIGCHKFHTPTNLSGLPNR